MYRLYRPILDWLYAGFLAFPFSLSPRRSTMGQLRDRMEQDLKLKGFSPATSRNYLLYCRRFAAFHMRSPEELGATGLNSFLLALNAFNWQAYGQRGRAHALQDENEKAIADYSRALALLPAQDSRRADILLRRANNYEVVRDYARALADLHELLRLDLGELSVLHPDLAWMCNRMAWQMVAGPEERRDPAQALPLALKAVALTAPELPLFLNTLGVAYYRLDQCEQAIQVLERSLGAPGSEDAPVGWFFLALSRSRRGEPTQAKACYDRAVAWLEERRDHLRVDKMKELDALRAEADRVFKKEQGVIK
jgi:tetratricopeptide (TPR) repeat protein